MKTNCPQCNKVTESKYSEKEELYYFYCADCKIGGKGKTGEEAVKEFKKQGDKLTTTAIIERPKNKNEFALYVQQHKNKFAENAPLDRKSTRLNSSHSAKSRMPSSA